MASSLRPLAAFLLGIAVVSVAAAEGPSLSDSVEEGARFELVRENPSVNGERRQVMRFEVDGLEQFALVLWPAMKAPEQGWPSIIFNHGYHPDPPRYGRNSQGMNDRPGDYYRGVVQALVDRGFVVLVPDFRGHNESDGLEYTLKETPSSYYARDSVAAFLAMDTLDKLDGSQRFMLGHSMGGRVTLAALNALGSAVASASIWSTMRVPSELLMPESLDSPLLVLHARDDAVTSVQGSEALARMLHSHGRKVALDVYNGSDHLFSGEQLDEAIARSVSWFANSKN
ncbi:MAG: alpha/beta fold hydrolase [Halioglobus sp.]